ncbi:MAG: trypsin-like peptidase domain-containing protein [Clostridia bacterium]|nr:trypsin-like peptidase domain-containing protein [Clostridia bacterium]
MNLDNGESVQGKVMWTQDDIDIAIIKIDAKNLTVAKLGDSDNLKIGNDVWAIGNPLGVEFQRTTTKGIISGVNRTLTFEENGKKIFMEDLIQTDASINSGNSGGPLINENGEVIGINTVKITTAEGIGFAVPINIVKPIIESFIEKNSFIEVNLGIYAYDKEIVKYVNSKITIDNGIYVTNVNRGSNAEKAGIKVGDIIMSIDGIETNKMIDLRKYIYTKKKGDVVSLVVNRRNKIENIKIEL